MRRQNLYSPFLKWAGSKRASVNTIRHHLPPARRLIEPFVGSGAIFLGTSYDNYLLADSNQDLIDLYRNLSFSGVGFIRCAESFFRPENNSEAKYYKFRNVFNSVYPDDIRSALFVYLNRHGYNGLCRYNRRREFNVPFGRYTSPHFPRYEMIDFARKCLSCDVDFSHRDFRKTMDEAGRGDCAYCDPPYVPLSKTASFTGYSGKGFTWQDQVDLFESAMAASKRGAFVAISNHDTPEIRKLYAGASIIELQVRRNINSNGAGRGKVGEILAIWD